MYHPLSQGSVKQGQLKTRFFHITSFSNLLLNSYERPYFMSA
jgi:hypothetical protein